jgi:hypothetical protein
MSSYGSGSSNSGGSLSEFANASNQFSFFDSGSALNTSGYMGQELRTPLIQALCAGSQFTAAGGVAATPEIIYGPAGSYVEIREILASCASGASGTMAFTIVPQSFGSVSPSTPDEFLSIWVDFPGATGTSPVFQQILLNTGLEIGASIYLTCYLMNGATAYPGQYRISGVVMPS